MNVVSFLSYALRVFLPITCIIAPSLIWFKNCIVNLKFRKTLYADCYKMLIKHLESSSDTATQITKVVLFLVYLYICIYMCVCTYIYISNNITISKLIPLRIYSQFYSNLYQCPNNSLVFSKCIRISYWIMLMYNF